MIKKFIQLLEEILEVKTFLRCTFRILGGVASCVPWGWRDSYRKMGNFGRVGDKSMLKMYKKAGIGREGDI